jgi:LytS/YehU family sensor histidine kinase
MQAEANTILVIVIIGIAVMLFLVVGFLLVFNINQRKKSESQKQMTELEMQSLRAQLNPHFMFNSLNAIQELILLEENEKSQTYLARFAKLLRMLLENTERPFVPLQREIELLQLYLSLENLRIPDLEFSINVDHSVDTEATQIPNMILQPYIENAIWHGLSPKKNDRKLQIRISKENGSTKYEIEDNGIGRKKAAELKSVYRKEHRSKGMELLSKRFKLLAKEYGSDIETNITDVIIDNEIKGTLVTIKVPVQFSNSKSK